MTTTNVSQGERSPAQVWGTQENAVQAGEHYLPLPEKKEDGLVIAHAVQTIRASPEDLYRLWKDVSLIPRWQERVISVTPIDDTLSHWIVGNPEKEDGAQIEFDSAIVDDVPGVGFSWQSMTPNFEQSGSVSFTPSPAGRGSLVTLLAKMQAPAGGAIASAIAGASTRSPQQTIIENLRHFKQIAETGEIPSVNGQPHGPRGLSGGFKEWLFGEDNPTPPGTSDQPQQTPTERTKQSHTGELE